MGATDAGADQVGQTGIAGFLAGPQAGKSNPLSLVLNRPPPTIGAIDFVVGAEKDSVKPVNFGAGVLGETIWCGNAAELHAIARASKRAVMRDGASDRARGNAKALNLATAVGHGIS